MNEEIKPIYHKWTSETAPKGKGKSYHKYTYTIADVVIVSGKALQTVRNDVGMKRLNLRDLEDVCKYVCLARKGKWK